MSDLIRIDLCFLICFIRTEGRSADCNRRYANIRKLVKCAPETGYVSYIINLYKCFISIILCIRSSRIIIRVLMPTFRSLRHNSFALKVGTYYAQQALIALQEEFTHLNFTSFFLICRLFLFIFLCLLIWKLF